MRLVDADALKERLMLEDYEEHDYCFPCKGILRAIDDAPTIEPERNVEELLPDGTLHLFTDTDLSKVDRVLVSQNGTHYGDLYYADGEPKTGKWITQEFGSWAECSECHELYDIPIACSNFCPNCGADMRGE